MVLCIKVRFHCSTSAPGLFRGRRPGQPRTLWLCVELPDSPSATHQPISNSIFMNGELTFKIPKYLYIYSASTSIMGGRNLKLSETISLHVDVNPICSWGERKDVVMWKSCKSLTHKVSVGNWMLLSGAGGLFTGLVMHLRINGRRLYRTNITLLSNKF